MAQEWTEDKKPKERQPKQTSSDKRVRLNLPSSTPLGDARASMANHVADPQGVYCPCCGRVNKIYPRGIHWQSGAWLCLLVKRYLTEERWYQVTEFYNLRGGDYAKLRFWDLCELKAGTDYDKRTSGMWKPTEKGIKFAQGKIRIPAKVLLYQDKCVGFEEGKDVDIHEILNTSEGAFSWSETMRGVEVP